MEVMTSWAFFLMMLVYGGGVGVPLGVPPLPEDPALSKIAPEECLLYFSSAGNAGNLTSGTSTSWEGDFKSGGTSTVLPGYTLHNFSGGQLFNRLLQTAGVIDLQWSDAFGASANDYDLFILNSAGTAILAASTDNQDGTGDPFERRSHRERDPVLYLMARRVQQSSFEGWNRPWRQTGFVGPWQCCSGVGSAVRGDQARSGWPIRVARRPTRPPASPFWRSSS